MRWNEAYEKKLQCCFDVLENRIYRPLGEIPFTGFFTYEHLTLAQACKFDRLPLVPNTPWGRKWEYGWFFAEIRISSDCEGQRILFESSNGESLVFVNGKVVGAFDRQHTHITLTRSAAAGEVFRIAMEVYAGHGKGLPQKNYIVLIPEENDEPLDESTLQKRISNGTFGIMQEEIFQFYQDLRILSNLRIQLEKHSLRRANIEQAIMDVCDLIDLELPTDAFFANVKECTELLQPQLRYKNSVNVPTFYAVGHSHLDLEWLWTKEETRRKAARTVGNQLELLKEYPDYKYFQSQPWLLEVLKNDYPELYEDVKKAVRAGSFIPGGSMWVEADTNIPSGESLIRQFILGKKFIRDEFGKDSQILWLPDIFGVSGSLPQIMRGCGVKYFFNAKISWLYNGGDAHPFGVFRWKGIDGTEVLADINMGYIDDVLPECLIGKWRNIEEKADVPFALLTYGFGDGGGGATRTHLEDQRRVADLEGCPKVISAGPEVFFREAEKCRVDRYFTGELYYAAHRGAYTSQAKTKKLNRRAELALRQAELWSALLGEKACRADLNEMWKEVLFNHFHDVIPGTSIAEVHAEAETTYGEILERTECISQKAVKTATYPSRDHISVFNPLSWKWDACVTLPKGFTAAYDRSGNALKRQKINGNTVVRAPLPACGWACFRIVQEPLLAICEENTAPVLENALIRAEFNSCGQLISLFDKEKNLEFIGHPSNDFRLYKDMPTFCDAWDIEPYYENQEVQLHQEATVRIQYRGPLISCIEITRAINNSLLKQSVILRSDSRVLEFQTEVDWQESHKLLKVDFHTNIHTDILLSDTQFGYNKRPTHRNRQADADRFEVCQHKWSTLAEGKRGFSILNDCKYGISALDSRMSLTLLRAPEEPARNADRGTQTFTYAVMPYTGAFEDSDVVREAYQLNCPPLTVEGAANDRSLIRISEKNIILETVKAAEDGSDDLVLRLYECMNSYTHCSIQFGFDIQAVCRTDMLEQPQKEIPVANNRICIPLKAFEIVTLRIKRENE